MAPRSRDAGRSRDVARAVLRRYPRTFGEQLGLRSLETPAGLFGLLVMASLMSARIRSTIALEATRSVLRHRWTTAERLAAASFEERARVLNEAGYARYDERTSRMLGAASEALLDRYRGDLRRLRAEAGREPSRERQLLKQLKGTGEVGVDIFFREVQRSWPELYPFADRRALQVAHRLGLGDDARSLTRLAEGDEFVRLVNGLVRVHLDRAYDEFEGAPARRTS
ncbi:MAG: hypothetical protein J2P59_07140 [Acidimicrobiales bacterium]|nr:hypothetical protein [Acidimicrobiales bacterium]